MIINVVLDIIDKIDKNDIKIYLIEQIIRSMYKV